MVPIHKHPTKDESFVILRGKVRVTTHNDDGSIIEEVGKKVRKAIQDIGETMPEDLPTAESIKTFESKMQKLLKVEHKRLSSSQEKKEQNN